MLLPGFRDHSKQDPGETFLYCWRSREQLAQRRIRLLAIEGHRFEIERSLVSERVIKTLSGDTHLMHEHVQRAVFVAKAPKEIHCRSQRTLGVKLLGPRHLRFDCTLA